MRSTRCLLQKAETHILKIKNALFKEDVKSKSYIFPKPIKDFEIFTPLVSGKPSFWAILGPKKFQFLNILAGKSIPQPLLSRVYPFIAEKFKYEKIQFLNFRESSGLDRVHLSARYESFSYRGELEISDDVNSVKNYITGANNYNSNSEILQEEYVEKLMKFFDLKHLEKKWINSLSNGQFRRARIAKSLVNSPGLLIIDDPFLGLDPEATELVSESLKRVSEELNISVALGIRIQDRIPGWIDSVAYVDEEGLSFSGDKDKTKPLLEEKIREISELHTNHEQHLKHMKTIEISNDDLSKFKVPYIEFDNASVIYKDLPILKSFNWKVDKGSKWRILGNNGTGKTTILSLITADHPQSWRSVLSIDGKMRKTGNGSTFFDVNNKIGISSPEIHALVPPGKTMKEIILNGLVKDVGNSNFMFQPKEKDFTEHANKILEQFKDRLDILGDKRFFDLTLTDQKLALFLRAMVKNPELLILDEAFSCMEDEQVMVRCHRMVENNKDLTVLAIGHIDWEVPRCDYMLKLTGDENRSYKLFEYQD